MAGYESIPTHFPVVVEEYWNRPLKCWVDKNQQRRMKAQYRSQMMGKEMVDAMIPELPDLMAIQPERRYHRFRMAKSYMLNEDRYNEITERCKRECEEEEAIRESKKGGNILQCTVEAVARLPERTIPPDEDAEDDDDAGTVAEGMSPKNFLDVDEMATDPLTIPYLGDALKTLGECDRCLTKTQVRTSLLPQLQHPPLQHQSEMFAPYDCIEETKKVPKKKGKSTIVKLEPIQSFEEDEEETEVKAEDAYADDVEDPRDQPDPSLR
eukprot:1872534-Amphidinium_carterae.1